MVPPKSGCGWQTTAKAGTVSGSPASVTGVSTSTCSAPAGPSIARRSARGGFSTMRALYARRPPPSGSPALRGGEPHQEAVQAQYEVRGIGERRPFGEGGLLVEQLRQLG